MRLLLWRLLYAPLGIQVFSGRGWTGTIRSSESLLRRSEIPLGHSPRTLVAIDFTQALRKSGAILGTLMALGPDLDWSAPGPGENSASLLVLQAVLCTQEFLQRDRTRVGHFLPK